MGVYFGDTEITGLYFGGTEITGLYFGDTEIWAAWAEYDGTLPAQYTANGDYLADYRIYGAAGGVGDKTENIFNGEITQGVYSTANGSAISAERYVKSSKIHLEADGYITLAFSCSEQGTTATGTGIDGFAYFWNESRYIGYYQATAKGTQTVQIPEGATYFAFAVGAGADGVLEPSDVSEIMLNYGSTAPAEYVPYGYVIPMSVSDGTTSTTTQIYIGSSPLGEDEYVSFEEQKVYRMSGGVLTPTDPPVPLPALPTVDGVTITDYAGQSAAVPSRFVAKYRKG